MNSRIDSPRKAMAAGGILLVLAAFLVIAALVLWLLLRVVGCEPMETREEPTTQVQETPEEEQQDSSTPADDVDQAQREAEEAADRAEQARQQAEEAAKVGDAAAAGQAASAAEGAATEATEAAARAGSAAAGSPGPENQQAVDQARQAAGSAQAAARDARAWADGAGSPGQTDGVAEVPASQGDPPATQPAVSQGPIELGGGRASEGADIPVPVRPATPVPYERRTSATDVIEAGREGPAPIRGQWVQTEGGNGADLLPGGYTESHLAFHADGTLVVTRTFGADSPMRLAWSVGFDWSEDKQTLLLGQDPERRPPAQTLTGFSMQSSGVRVRPPTTRFPASLTCTRISKDVIKLGDKTYRKSQ